MGILEDMLIKAKDAANNMTDKAGKFMDISKMNIEIVEAKGKLKSAYENLGKIVYQNEKNGISVKQTVKEEISKIDQICDNIEKLNKELALLKKKVICKACGEPNPSGAFYCNKCGHTLEIQCTFNSNCNCNPSDNCGCENENDNECDCNSSHNCGCDEDNKCDCQDGCCDCSSIFNDEDKNEN